MARSLYDVSSSRFSDGHGQHVAFNAASSASSKAVSRLMDLRRSKVCSRATHCRGCIELLIAAARFPLSHRRVDALQRAARGDSPHVLEVISQALL